ncbi:hypothetical protein MNBD_GAMMA09-1937 [hydrothermal vent metagenome]|uniref:Uncharacterized protein n=1 Tax=hydrothermal vent metagenome TaxID=652676 RepID=A0A3B0XW78_9ZZZZ
MKRIFYYSGYRLTVFHWKNEKCIASFAFNPGDDGLEKFATYLKATTNTPVRILVDLIEEDFIYETIPHVGSVDRKSIVGRIIERQYRNSRDYYYYKVLQREKTGRRDDKIIYSVLSNPAILEPWLEPMKNAGIAISGIWSLPLLSENLANYIDNKSRNILIVSQQVPSNLRQTLIKNGRFESSRSAVVNLLDASIGEYISTEVEQTIRFLSNQRHIGFDEKIEVHIICRESDIIEIKNYCEDGNLLSFHYHCLEDIENKINCHTQSAEYSNGLYSYICANIKVPIGHYGNKELFSNYYQHLISISMYVASILIFLFSCIFSLSYLSESYLFEKEVVTIKNHTKGINNDYHRQLSSIEHKLGLTQTMQSSVLFSDKIKSSKIISPQNFMVDISRILGYSGMYNTKISSISWQLNQSSEFQPKVRNTVSVDHASSKAINQLATITGNIDLSHISLKQAVNKTYAISDTFKKNQLIQKIRLNKMPVDTRSQSSIENEKSHSHQSQNSTDKSMGEFEIELIMRARKS